MIKKQEKHVIDIFFVIALFCVFALAAGSLILIGADIYSKTVSHMESNFNTRTSFAYLTEKIRQSDQADAISAGELDGRPALMIRQELDDRIYVTCLYEYEGYLKELMVREDTPLGPEAGQDIMAVSEFDLTRISDNLFSFSLTAEGGEHCQLLVSTRSTGGDADEK